MLACGDGDDDADDADDDADAKHDDAALGAGALVALSRIFDSI